MSARIVKKPCKSLLEMRAFSFKIQGWGCWLEDPEVDLQRFHLRQRFGCANLLTCGHLLEDFFKGSYKSCCRGCGFGFDVQTSDETLKTLHFELGSAIDVR